MFLKKCQEKKCINIIARYFILEKFVFNEFKVAMATKWLCDLLLLAASHPDNSSISVLHSNRSTCQQMHDVMQCFCRFFSFSKKFVTSEFLQLRTYRYIFCLQGKIKLHRGKFPYSSLSFIKSVVRTKAADTLLKLMLAQVSIPKKIAQKKSI